MSSASSPAIEPGDVLMNKYRVDRVLGAGGMGQVLAATHLTLGHQVALKVLLTGTATNEQYQRFLREARAALRLRSEHAARVLDVGTMENGAPFMLMELLEGRDLAAEIKDRGPLGVAEAVDYVLQASHAVAEAHAAGIVHRDLKPANLFLTTTPEGTPRIKVLDFGISKVVDELVALTSDQQALGSPLYMSPEQMRSSRDVDARTDVWALGATLYQLVAGHPPFPGRTVQEVCSRVFMDAPVPLATYRSDIPPGFEAVLAQSLEKDRSRRFANVAAFAAALAPYGPVDADKSAERVGAVLGERIAPARPTATLWPAALPPAAGADAPPPTAAMEGAAPQGAAVVPGLVQSGSSAALTTGSALVSSSAAATRKRRTGVVAGAIAGVLLAVLATVGLVRGRALVGGAPSSGAGTAAPSASVTPPAPEPSAMATTATPAESVAPPMTAASAATSATSATSRATTLPARPAQTPSKGTQKKTRNIYDD